MSNELENLFKETQKNPYVTFGFFKNPFPTNARESYKICYNQDDVKKIFINKLRSFITDQNIETLIIGAEHRVGKTNFLLHYYHKLKHISLDVRDKTFKYAYIRDYGDNFLVIHKALIMALGENFFLDLLNKLNDKKAMLNELSDTDFKKGLLSCFSSRTFAGFDPNKISLFLEWFEGIKCTQRELKELGVFSNITTSSLAIRYLRDLIQISRSLGIMNGLMIFMDEFELIFGESVSRAKRDKYLQDLRSLIDEIQVGIFIVSAITPTALVELSKNYQALKARFGDSISLSPIRNVDEAQAYAEEYINSARSEFIEKSKENKTKKFKNIIEKEEIDKLYKELAGPKEEISIFESSTFKLMSSVVRQGFFFERLHNYIEDKIAKSS